MRAFIFSLDAFVAFTLALMAIYSLIFFSSVPASYYFLLTQGHYLARDTLLSLSTTPCVGATYCTTSSTMLESIAFNSNPMRKILINRNIDAPLIIPKQFGFTVEVANEGAEGGWTKIYDRAVDSTEPSIIEQFRGRNKRISVSSQVLAFGYTGTSDRSVCSTYRYRTCPGGCGGGGSGTDGPGRGGGSGGDSGSVVSLPIITCGNSLNNRPGTFSSSSSSPPSPDSSGELSPGSSGFGIGSVSSPTQARLVRITVYI